MRLPGAPSKREGQERPIERGSAASPCSRMGFVLALWLRRDPVAAGGTRGLRCALVRGMWVDLRGVVHVHTRGSHDSPGTIAEVVAAARSAGVSWVAITEHTRPGELGPWGVIDGVTVIPGFELRSAGASLLAIGVTPCVKKQSCGVLRACRGGSQRMLSWTREEPPSSCRQSAITPTPVPPPRAVRRLAWRWPRRAPSASVARVRSTPSRD